MKLNSKYFDSIRVSETKSKKRKSAKAKKTKQRCCWQGCEKMGEFPAPRGRDSEGEYYYFCKEHVQKYNKGYNYFDGMPNDEVVDYQKSSETGHRPTWQMGGKTGEEKQGRATGRYNKTNGFGGFRSAQAAINSDAFEDPFELFAKQQQEKDPDYPAGNYSPGRSLQRKHLNTLGLDVGAKRDEIKARYKELVKKHHPDVNKGDKNSEERLREIITAYNFLKQAGLVN